MEGIERNDVVVRGESLVSVLKSANHLQEKLHKRPGVEANLSVLLKNTVGSRFRCNAYKGETDIRAMIPRSQINAGFSNDTKFQYKGPRYKSSFNIKAQFSGPVAPNNPLLR